MDTLPEPFLLNIPMECRLRIYDYCLEDNCFTIGSAEVKNPSDKKSTKSSTAKIGIADKDSSAKKSTAKPLTPTATHIADTDENSTSGSSTNPIDLTEDDDDDDDEKPMAPSSYTSIVGLPADHAPVVRSFYHPQASVVQQAHQHHSLRGLSRRLGFRPQKSCIPIPCPYPHGLPNPRRIARLFAFSSKKALDLIPKPSPSSSPTPTESSSSKLSNQHSSNAPRACTSQATTTSKERPELRSQGPVIMTWNAASLVGSR